MFHFIKSIDHLPNCELHWAPIRLQSSARFDSNYYQDFTDETACGFDRKRNQQARSVIVSGHAISIIEFNNAIFRYSPRFVVIYPTTRNWISKAFASVCQRRRLIKHDKKDYVLTCVENYHQQLTDINNNEIFWFWICLLCEFKLLVVVVVLSVA